ncbi:hypothetical protein [Methylomonas koyamae]|nr:hypothetical protein [Methylomonas koyamae]
MIEMIGGRVISHGCLGFGNLMFGRIHKVCVAHQLFEVGYRPANNRF